VYRPAKNRASLRMAVVCSHLRGRPCEVLGMGTQISGVPVKNGAGEWFVMSFAMEWRVRRIGNKNTINEISKLRNYLFKSSLSRTAWNFLSIPPGFPGFAINIDFVEQGLRSSPEPYGLTGGRTTEPGGIINASFGETVSGLCGEA